MLTHKELLEEIMQMKRQMRGWYCRLYEMEQAIELDENGKLKSLKPLGGEDDNGENELG